MNKSTEILHDEIRLACLNCDTEEYDGISPAVLAALERLGEWKDITEADVPEDDQMGCWWTHLGLCPDCVAAYETEYGRPYAKKKRRKREAKP